MDQPHLGHKMPRPGQHRLSWCPRCLNEGRLVPLTSRHVLDNCPSVEHIRRELGIRSFLDSCLRAGRSRAKAYKNYLLGLDKDNIKVDLKSYLARGAHLQELTDAWLETWEERSD